MKPENLIYFHAFKGGLIGERVQSWPSPMAAPGYPMTEVAWSGPGEMETRFEIARQIGLGRSGLHKFASDPPTTKDPAPPPAILQNSFLSGNRPHTGVGDTRCLKSRRHRSRQEPPVPVFARIYVPLGSLPIAKQLVRPMNRPDSKYAVVSLRRGPSLITYFQSARARAQGARKHTNLS